MILATLLHTLESQSILHTLGQTVSTPWFFVFFDTSTNPLNAWLIDLHLKWSCGPHIIKIETSDMVEVTLDLFKRELLFCITDLAVRPQLKVIVSPIFLFHVETGITDIHLSLIYFFETVAVDMVAHVTGGTEDNLVCLLDFRVEAYLAVIVRSQPISSLYPSRINQSLLLQLQLLQGLLQLVLCFVAKSFFKK